MAKEINEIPAAVQRLVDHSLQACTDLGRTLRAAPPPAIVTCARGTSDQAALYFKYLSETRAGIPVASLGPSVASVYGADLQVENLPCLTISQSGGSPDLAALQGAAAKGGARTIALLNTPSSPVGNGAQTVIDLQAGPETAVAATKSFVCSLVALAGIIGGMTDDSALIGEIALLPSALEAALTTASENRFVVFRAASSLYVISRGPGMASAGEAALKLKETCQIHAEAVSAAEMMHGPSVLTRRGISALAFLPTDEGRASVLGAVAAFEAEGNQVVSIGHDAQANLFVEQAIHPALVPIVQITAFYRQVEALSRDLGFAPDHPPGLSKVTKTV